MHTTDYVADAPWCGHCKNLAPEYAKAASMLAEEKSAIRLAKIDASLYRDVAQKYSVKGYPTIKLFVDKLESFHFSSGQRTAPVIVRWLKKRVAEHPFTFVHSVETARWLISSNELVAFGFIKASDMLFAAEHNSIRTSSTVLRSRAQIPLGPVSP